MRINTARKMRGRQGAIALLAAATTGGAATVLFVSGAGASAGPPPGMVPTHSCAENGLSRIPQNVEMNTVHDFEHGLLQMSYDDPETKEERRVVIDYRNDKECRARSDVRHVIEHAEQVTAENLASQCAWLEEFQRSGGDTIRGVKIDQEALQEHMDQWCAD